MKRISIRHRQRGLTLVEVVTSITVVALAGMAVLGVLAYLSSGSGSALADSRARAVADMYLNEALARPFTDPDRVDGEAARAAFDDVDDYDGIDDATAVDFAGNPAGAFRVRVSVVPDALGTLPASDVRRVNVRVDLPDGRFVLASGYRTRYP
jgi:MSHA pilin protein MshD